MAKILPFYTPIRFLCVSKYKIAINKPPTEDNLYDFLEEKFRAGYKSTTMRSNYSHLNLACDELYGEKLKVSFLPLFSLNLIKVWIE